MKMYPIQVGFLSESHEETGHECQGGCEECSCGGGQQIRLSKYARWNGQTLINPSVLWEAGGIFCRIAKKGKGGFVPLEKARRIHRRDAKFMGDLRCEDPCGEACGS